MSRGRLLEGLKEAGGSCVQDGRVLARSRPKHDFSQQGACNTWQVAVLSLSMENKPKYSCSSLTVTRLVQTKFISSETKACCVSYGNC